jgi:hypothetical protein
MMENFNADVCNITPTLIPLLGLTRGKTADSQIYLEATYLQDPGLEAHLVKYDFLISSLDKGSKLG